MKIRTQFLTTMLLFGLILVVTAVLLAYTYQGIERLNTQEETTGRIERAAAELSYLSNDYLLNRDKDQENRWRTASAELSTNLASLRLDMPEQKVLAERLRSNHARLENIFNEVSAAVDGGKAGKDEAGAIHFAQVSWSRLEILNQTVIFDATQLSASLINQEDDLRQRSNLLLFALISVFGAYLILNYFTIYRRTLRSLANLQAGAAIIGAGRLDHVIDDRGKDEIGALSTAFNQMTRNLREITASKADLEREIAERQQAQAELLESEAELRKSEAELRQSEAELRKSEAELRQSEARLRRLVEANIIGVITRDGEGRLEDANDAFLQMVGYSRAELEAGGLNLLDLTPAEDRPAEADLASGSPRERALLRKDGRRVPVLAGETQIEGERPMFIGFVLDLSDLKQAQAALAEYAEKLQQSNQELEQFAFIASHDLQEPLRKVRAFGDTLARRLGDKLEPEPREYLVRMQNAAERMQVMINDLLELSRVGRRGEKFVPICLADLTNEVLSDLEPRIQSARAQVQMDLGPEKIEADPLQMRQLLQNLLSNAIKYHRADGVPEVRVWSRQEPDGGGRPAVTIAVQDNGIGFSEEYLDRIFQPFTRLHGRGEYEGTGMGLAICKKIVERHQGTITARSRPGEGATFFVTIPTAQK